jgi:hypothetical protein
VDPIRDALLMAGGAANQARMRSPPVIVQDSNPDYKL